MRVTYNSKVLVNNGVFQGFNLGADYCAEHEWGIKELSNTFGLCSKDKYDEVIGFDRFKATKVPEVMRVIQFQRRKIKYVSLFVSSERFLNTYEDSKIKECLIPYPLERSDGEFTNAAWDSRAFEITVPYEKREYIYDLKKAIEDCNVVLFFPEMKNPFGRSGLCIVKWDTLTNEMKNDTVEKHKEENRLLDAANKTGVAEILKAAKKYWYALRPAWAEEMKNHSKTKYPVVFYLNPEKQDLYNFGWFTVEELILWAGDKGPVIKDKRR